MLEELKEIVCEENRKLVRYGLVILTWGNVSAIDRSKGVIVIKPSGVSYDNMIPDDMVIVDLEGKVVEGRYKPSSDTLTHLEIYRMSDKIGGVVHTHSTYATAWAQTGLDIPNIGTTHSDNFLNYIPCTRELRHDEIENDYERNTGILISETFHSLSPLDTPAVLVRNHGPFVWGKDAEDAVSNSAVLEQISKMAFISLSLNPALSMDRKLIEKHFYRKHGSKSYYGQ